MKIPNSLTAMVVSTIWLDTGASSPLMPSKHCKLLGVGLATHSVASDSSLRFRVRSNATTLQCGDERELLAWINDELALPTVIVGCDLESSLQELIDKANPVDHPSIMAMTTDELRAGQLSSPLLGPAWGRLSVACADAGIRVIGENSARDQRDWLSDRSEKIQERLLLQAVATWKLWAASQMQQSVTDERLVVAGTRLDGWLDEQIAYRCLPTAHL